jgi:hypothetical protein
MLRVALGESCAQIGAAELASARKPTAETVAIADTALFAILLCMLFAAPRTATSDP